MYVSGDEDSDGYHLINPKTKKEIATKLDYSKYERIDMVDSNSTVYGFVLNDKYFYSVKSNKNGDKVEHIIPNYYYSLCDDYLLEAKKG